MGAGPGRACTGLGREPLSSGRHCRAFLLPPKSSLPWSQGPGFKTICLHNFPRNLVPSSSHRDGRQVCVFSPPTWNNHFTFQVLPPTAEAPDVRCLSKQAIMELSSVRDEGTSKPCRTPRPEEEKLNHNPAGLWICPSHQTHSLPQVLD